MNQKLSKAELERARELVAQRLGLHFPGARSADLMRGVWGAVQSLNLDSFTAMETLLENTGSRHIIDALAAHLTVGETYFFRDKSFFQALETVILPTLIERAAARRILRIWSAGCCTGEEPYSIAMVLERLLPDLDDWSVSILATDLNRAFLAQAKQGIFGEWSFRDVNPAIKARYFQTCAPNRYQLKERVRKRVRFAQLNLTRDAFPSTATDTHDLDLILCRNVLMYFAPERIREAIARFHDCLTEGSYLVVSPSETSMELFHQFESEFQCGAVLYRKMNLAVVEAKASSESRPVRLERPSLRAGGPIFPTSMSPPRALPESQTQRVAARLSAPLSQPSAPPLPQPPAPPSVAEQSLLEAARGAADAGQLTQALALCDHALEKLKLNASIYYLRGTVLTELGRSSEAVQSFQRALYLDPQFVMAHFALGNLALQRGEHRIAQRHLNNVLSLLGASEAVRPAVGDERRLHSTAAPHDRPRTEAARLRAGERQRTAEPREAAERFRAQSSEVPDSDPVPEAGGLGRSRLAEMARALLSGLG